MLEAFHNYIVVKLDQPEEKLHPSGLALPAQREEKPCYGVITSVGPNSLVQDLRVGTHVLIPPAGIGVTYREGNDEFIILLDHELYGVIVDE